MCGFRVWSVLLVASQSGIVACVVDGPEPAGGSSDAGPAGGASSTSSGSRSGASTSSGTTSGPSSSGCGDRCSSSSVGTTSSSGASSAAARAWVTETVSGHDFRLPASVQPTPNSGLFSETAMPQYNVNTHVVDVTWKQLKPTRTTFSDTASASVYGMTFPGLASQLAVPGDYWLRVWVSGDDWVPDWVKTPCDVRVIGEGYEGYPQVAIWDGCVWTRVMELYRELLVTRGMAGSARLRFIYVPGAFTCCEYDDDLVDQAIGDGDLTVSEYSTWYCQVLADLVAIVNGENADAGVTRTVTARLENVTFAHTIPAGTDIGPVDGHVRQRRIHRLPQARR